MLNLKNFASSDASNRLPCIQDYLDLDRPNHVAIKLAALPYFSASWMHTDREKREALREVALMVARYGDFIERQYSEDDRRRAEQLLFYRGVPLVEKPEFIERGAYRIWYGCTQRLETFAGEQSLTVVVHTKETEPPEGECPLFVDDAIANCELIEHVLGHWECIILSVNTARHQDIAGMATLIFDALPDILPDYMDAATLPEGHSKPMPTGVLNKTEYDFWQSRAPEYTQYYDYCDNLDVWLSVRHQRILHMASHWFLLRNELGEETGLSRLAPYSLRLTRAVECWAFAHHGSIDGVVQCVHAAIAAEHGNESTIGGIAMQIIDVRDRDGNLRRLFAAAVDDDLLLVDLVGEDDVIEPRTGPFAGQKIVVAKPEGEDD